MGRKYTPQITRDAGGVVRYLPALDNNRKDPEPFACGITPVNYADITTLELSAAALIENNEGMTVTEFERERDMSMVAKYVKWVENYECVDLNTGEIRKPTTGEELVTALKSTFIAEAEAVLGDLLGAIKGTKEASAGFLPEPN